MVHLRWQRWASSLLALSVLSVVEGTGVVGMDVCRNGCSAVPQDMWPYCCESHNTCCQEFADSCVHDCLPRVNSGDVSVVEERPGLCCALYNLCCFRETYRISPKRKSEEPASLPIVHRFSFPTSSNQRQQTSNQPRRVSAPVEREDERPEVRNSPFKPALNRPQLPRKLPGSPRDNEESNSPIKAPRRPQLPRKLPIRPSQPERDEEPRNTPERPEESVRPQLPNRPKFLERPQSLRKTENDKPSEPEEPQTPRKQLQQTPGGLQQGRPRKIKVRPSGPRPLQRNRIEAEPSKVEEVPEPLQAVSQQVSDRRGQSKPDEPVAEPVTETPVSTPVESAPIQEAIAEEDGLDDIVLLPNPLDQNSEPALGESIPPVVAPQEPETPTYLPVETPEDFDIPTYLPVEISDVIAAPQPPQEEVAPAVIVEPIPTTQPPSPEAETESADVARVSISPAASPSSAPARGSTTQSRGRSRGSSSRGRASPGTEDTQRRSRSRSRG